MQPKRILGGLAVVGAILAPLVAHAAPDQAKNRGYVVGDGGVARSTNGPQTDGAGTSTTVPKQTQQATPKQTQQATFGERVNAGPPQAGNAGASAATAQTPTEACSPRVQGNEAATNPSGQANATGGVRVSNGNLDSCNGLIR